MTPPPEIPARPAPAEEMPVDPYIVPILATLSVLSIGGIAGAVVVTVVTPDQSGPVNTWLLAFLGPSLLILAGYISKRLSAVEDQVKVVEHQLDGRLTEFLSRLDQGRADQHSIGYSEGREARDRPHPHPPGSIP